jgi:glycosyltransferase involved in cell wall biosynthesis
LVVDGPIPESLDQIIDRFVLDNDLIVCRLPENKGLFNALNHGLKIIDTEWTVRSDADDYNRPDRFESLSNAFCQATETLDIVGSEILEVDKDGTKIAVRRTPQCHSDIVHYARKRSPFNHMTVAFRTQLVKDVGGYPDVYLKEDYALWVQLLANGARAANVPDTLVHATTGREMYKRRGGLRYAFSEFKLQKLLVKCGLKGWGVALLHGTVRSIVFLAPARLRSMIYLKFLRDNA